MFGFRFPNLQSCIHPQITFFPKTFCLFFRQFPICNTFPTAIKFRYNADYIQPILQLNMTLTADEFRLALPDKVKKSINQELIDKINATLANPEEFEHYRNNLISYTSVMKDGKFKIEQYLDAVRYVSFKLLGSTNIEAYSKTFPEKITSFTANGVSSKDIASYVAAYNKGKLVNLIFEQTLIPVHVLNMDMHQKALNHLSSLMMTAKSEMVQKDAAVALLAHLKPPEVKKIELDIGTKEDGSINALRETTMELVAQQRAMLQSGMVNAQEIAHQRLSYNEGDVIDVPVKEVTR